MEPCGDLSGAGDACDRWRLLGPSSLRLLPYALGEKHFFQFLWSHFLLCHKATSRFSTKTNLVILMHRGGK